MTSNTSPLHQFRVFVAQRLQQPPFNWGGSCGYDLERRYGDLVQEYWNEGETVDDTAAAVDKLYMNRYRPDTSIPTRANLERAGCRFVGVPKD